MMTLPYVLFLKTTLAVPKSMVNPSMWLALPMEIKTQSSQLHQNEQKNQQSNQHLAPHAIITDIRMPMMDGLSFSEWLGKEFPDISIIIMTAHSDLQSAIDSYQTGAFEYLPKPFDLDEAVTVVQKAINRNVHYQQQLASTKLTKKLTNKQADNVTNSSVIDNNIDKTVVDNKTISLTKHNLAKHSLAKSNSTKNHPTNHHIKASSDNQ